MNRNLPEVAVERERIERRIPEARTRLVRWMVVPASCFLIQTVCAVPLFAHPGHGGGGFGAGFAHPFAGVDHLLAMLAVGLLAVRSGGRSLWLLPVSFSGSLLAGGAAAAAGIPLMGVEYAIAVSVVALGTLLAMAGRLPSYGEGIVVAGFALFHGHAHVAELSGQASFTSGAAGFVAATLLLHAAGIAAGWLLLRGIGTKSLRVGGAAIAAAGLALFVALV